MQPKTIAAKSRCLTKHVGEAQMHSVSWHASWRILGGALLSCAVAATAQAEVKLPGPAVSQAAVAKRVYFYVGGQCVGEPGKDIMQGQMYVEVLAPKKQLRPYPLV